MFAKHQIVKVVGDVRSHRIRMHIENQPAEERLIIYVFHLVEAQPEAFGSIVTVV